MWKHLCLCVVVWWVGWCYTPVGRYNMHISCSCSYKCRHTGRTHTRTIKWKLRVLQDRQKCKKKKEMQWRYELKSLQQKWKEAGGVKKEKKGVIREKGGNGAFWYDQEYTYITHTWRGQRRGIAPSNFVIFCFQKSWLSYFNLVLWNSSPNEFCGTTIFNPVPKPDQFHKNVFVC